ncbi:6-phospho-beta-glucosidase [Demetria terragena]|uniref:6-phospho-beta-glucosidase n=1 Tax=Demetria terragena TaxID=63959 RepID=UPI00058E080F|nr:6-phospho-beta-glucosidase [Demetria terragena]
MKLAMLGGGGFRTPLVYGALLRDRGPGRVTQVVLQDSDPARLAVISGVLRQMANGVDDAPTIVETVDLDQALTGADFVFSAIRVGGLAGRIADERVALDLGVLGQETTGPGGLAYALRTVPVALDIAERVARCAPQAWVINFTNPAGIVTEAMQGVLGDRVIGICDSPIGLARRAIQALGLRDAEASVEIDYVGLNHLGWLRGLNHDGRDVLPDLLADADRLMTLEEGRLFGPAWLATLGAIPNEYLYYYYYNREAVAAIIAADQTRGEFVRDQQEAFYRAAERDPERASDLWNHARAEREATYMREARADDEARDAEDLESGGYEGVALALMRAIAHDEPARLILNVRNGATVPQLPEDASVEVMCTVDQNGPRPVSIAPPQGAMLGLMQQVKAVERLVIQAVREGSADRALAAFANHPLVDSVTTARNLLDGYCTASHDTAALLHS